MRYLNKLVFINSATIPYAEVQLNGNVHLIGTQGVGKSTLLRAILFFYNSDTLKLGISREKRSFADYYFPYQNAYIVYEVVRETGAYCILAFKSQGKVCFRFFDAPYDRQFFITDTGQALERWEDIRQKLDQQNILYTRKIDRYEEYRDIIYGNADTVRPDDRRYAILQSRQYQNIPRTIQNVFLNSKLDAEFIKQTIIMSLNEEDISIDLQHYGHHLKHFEEQLHDIHQFRLPSVQKLTDRIIRMHQEIRYNEQEKKRLAQHLAWAAAHTGRQLPKVADKIEKITFEQHVLEERIENAVTRHVGKIKKLESEMGVLRNHINTAKGKVAYYHELGMDALLERTSKKAACQSRERELAMEIGLLNRQWGAIADKHAALLAAHDNNTQAYLQGLEKELIDIRSGAMQEQQKLQAALLRQLDAIRKSHEAILDERNIQIETAQHQLQDAQIKRERTRHMRFREAEILACKQQVEQLSLAVKDAGTRLEHLKVQTDNLRRQGELEEAALLQQAAKQTDALLLAEQQCGKLLTILEQQLANSSESLYGWLNENRPGWEQTIGKIADEQVLFRQDLSPVQQEGTHAFYGLTLDLTALPVRVKTLAEYEQERNGLTAQLEGLKAKRTAIETSLEAEREQLGKKYKAKLRGLREEEQQLRFQLERDERNGTAEKLRLKDLSQQAEAEKQEALQQCDTLVAAASEQVAEAKMQRTSAAQELERNLAARKRETDRQLAQQQMAQEAAIAGIAQQQSAYNAEAKARREALLAARDRELNQKGVDTGRIRQLEVDLKAVQEELAYIDQNWAITIEYKKDKRDLIDKVPGFKQALESLEQQLHAEELRHHSQQAKYKEEKTFIYEQIQALQEQHRQLQEDQEAFFHFSTTPLWQNIDATWKQERDTHKTDRRCRQIIAELNQCSSKLYQLAEDLKESISRFLGSFSANNIFSFKPQLTLLDEYLAFASELDEFVVNDKIGAFENRVNERFATIIHSVGRETELLMSKGHEIQKVINDINRDFESKNFVTAIQKIELRVDESANTIVRLLLQIKKFNEEHAFELGGLNLFSSVDQEAKNKKAVDLLKQLAKAIAEQKNDSIALSDTFELKFRVEENQNDSGWVEKLSNVGSEGTDVLVKAMINIMLLNVFKEAASRKFREFRLHCMMDEIGRLHPVNVKGILQFANDRNINLINGSPTEANALDYKHIYRLERDVKRLTRIKKIITNNAHA